MPEYRKSRNTGKAGIPEKPEYWKSRLPEKPEKPEYRKAGKAGIPEKPEYPNTGKAGMPDNRITGKAGLLEVVLLFRLMLFYGFL